jgi:hypothetical protein
VLTGIQFGFTLSFLITFLAFIVGRQPGRRAWTEP